MAANKTVPTEQTVEDFLSKIEDERKRKDSFAVVELMKQATGTEPTMWGSSIVGFGNHHYKYESGREGDIMIAGFSPRKANLTFYGLGSFFEDEQTLRKLGKYTTGKGCLYIKRLDDVDLPTLKHMMEESFKRAQHQS
jgi:hypothetical protein